MFMLKIIRRYKLMLAMLWASEIMNKETVEEQKAMYAETPRRLKEKVKAILVNAGFEEITEE